MSGQARGAGASGAARGGRRRDDSRSTGARTQESARLVAWTVLDAVERRGAYANLLLPQTLGRTRLDARDRAFATDLVYTTLRWRGLLDAVIEVCASRQVSAIDPASLSVLRLCAAQALLLGVPAHAAVSTAVDLVSDVGAPGARGFVNAVMRSACARDLAAWQDVCADSADPMHALGTRFSHPRWIVSAFRDSLVAAGRDTADLPAVLQADNDAPRPTLCARPGLADAEDLRARLDGSPGRWSTLAVTEVRGDIGAIEEVRAGSAAAQDEGSQIVALIAAGIPLAGPDQQWLDLCAGPGGKAALLAGLAALRGGSLTAVELHEHRAHLVAQALRGYPGVRCVVADATDLGQQDWYQAGSFDRVLLDAPCTGIGSLRRRPDLRWQRRAADVADLAPLQEQLLQVALEAVRPGGVVTYATCSPHLSETTAVVTRAREAAAARGIGSEVLDLPAMLPQVTGLRSAEQLAVTAHGRPYLQMWPDVHGTDAMFVSVLRRM